jgi:hypothetical protein
MNAQKGIGNFLKDMNLKRSIIWQPPYKHRSFLAIMQDSPARSWHCELVKKLSGYSLGDELSPEQKTRLATW